MIRKIFFFMKDNLKRGFDMREDIKKEDIKELVREGAKIVDVRSPQEYREGHINGAICIPEYDIKRKAEQILKDKNEIIILYCSTGERSKKAQKKLKRMGYKNVYNLYLETPLVSF